MKCPLCFKNGYRFGELHAYNMTVYGAWYCTLCKYTSMYQSLPKEIKREDIDFTGSLLNEIRTQVLNNYLNGKGEYPNFQDLYKEKN